MDGATSNFVRVGLSGLRPGESSALYAIGRWFQASPGISATTITTDRDTQDRSIEPVTGRRLDAGLRAGSLESGDKTASRAPVFVSVPRLRTATATVARLAL
jgi:hypothetical protein